MITKETLKNLNCKSSKQPHLGSIGNKYKNTYEDNYLQHHNPN